jgi:phage terminase large subunit-like protein
MGPATARFYSAVVDRLLSHDGSSALARHVAAAILKEDSRGARLAKERRDSPRKIDAAVAAVMAHDRAAVLAATAGRQSTSDAYPRTSKRPREHPNSTEAVR